MGTTPQAAPVDARTAQRNATPVMRALDLLCFQPPAVGSVPRCAGDVRV